MAYALSRTATHAALLVWRTKAFWSRAFLCWLIGALFFLSDGSPQFDLRFQLRPARAVNPDVVLLEVSEPEWADLLDKADSGSPRNVLRPLKEIVQITDSYYWKASIWRQLLRKVLTAGPAKVGVAFYFGDEARGARSTLGVSDAVLEDPRVIWSAELDAAGHVAAPGLATDYNRNVALKTLRVDDDGVLRRFDFDLAPLPHLAWRLAETIAPTSGPYLAPGASKVGLLDFAGPAGTYRSYAFRDLLEGRLAPGLIDGKVVIIGPRDMATSGTMTPLGYMSRAEALANVVDSAAQNRWIRRGPALLYLALLAGLLAVSIWILSAYPQSVALAFFAGLALLWASASAWAFDAKHFWLPVLAPTIQMTATYIVFLSYQLARNEQKAWRLEQDRRYVTEVESLKNNFVSMMSHDLKTPIAKIQAIASRALAAALAAGKDPEYATDLGEVLRASEDLHRYIRSILQVTTLEARDFKIRREPIDVNDAIARAVERLRPLAADKGIVLEERLETMFSIEADPNLIQEVVLNLVENAIKYAAPDGGRVLIVSEETHDNVRVSVEDDGPGIEPSEQAGIWGKFTRGRKQSQDARGPSGSGLGLYLVKYFVELHGGRVFLDAERPRGTKIGFTIPVAPATPGGPGNQ